MKVREFLEKYWEQKQIKKWDFLYKSSENDQNLYFIKKWQILLSINWQQIAIVGENEVSWEKSFINKNPKPIDAQAITDLEVLVLNPEEFEKLDLEIQASLLKALTLFVSDRVYLLNDIITSLSFINSKIIEDQPSLSLDYLNTIFNFIELENIYIYKVENDLLLPIYESKIDFSLQEEVKQCDLNNVWIRTLESKIYLKIWEFVIILEWRKTKWDYIINNILIHSVWTLKYLCYILEEKKNSDLNDLLD